ncbi:MAG: hypothetical protein AMXMBFR49_14970 [Chlorobiota bacterium]
MIGIGALFSIFRGFSERTRLKKKVRELGEELGKDPFADLNGIERFTRISTLLDAEKQFWLDKVNTINEKIEILEKVISIMKSEISIAENELKRTRANKHDIALLAVNIQELALNTIKDIENVNKSVLQLDSQIVATADALEKLSSREGENPSETSNIVLNLSEGLKEVNNSINTIKKRYNELDGRINVIQAEAKQNHDAISQELKGTLKELHDLVDQVLKNKSSLEKKLTLLSSDLDGKLSEIKKYLTQSESDLKLLRNETSKIAQTVTQNHKSLTKELKDAETRSKAEIDGTNEKISKLRKIVFFSFFVFGGVLVFLLFKVLKH